MAKPAAKRVKVEKGTDSKPTPTGKKTNGWEYCGDYRMERDDMVDGISLSSMPEVEQQHWLVARGVQIKTSRRRHDVLAHRTTGRGPAVRTWSTTSRMTRNRSSSQATASSSSATTSSSTRTSRRTRTRASRRCRVTTPPSFFGTDNYKLVIRRRRRPRRRRPELEPPDVAEALL